MGKTEKRELVSRLTVLLPHLLKWRHQPSHRGKSWRLSIADARNEIIDHLEDNPSLKVVLDSANGAGLPIGASEGGDRDGIGRGGIPGALPLEFCRGDG